MIETIAHGSIGGPVARLQEALRARGYRITDAEGKFAGGTHNAVIALQARAGLPITGEVGAAEWSAAKRDAGDSPPMPEPALAEHLPFIEARFWKRGVVRHVVDHVVLHSMEAPEASTRAERCARNMAELDPALPSSKWKSAHYFVDCDSAAQGVLDIHIAYHAPGANKSGIGIEHAGYARQTGAEWMDDFSRPMLALSAQLSAHICKRWNIPAVYVDAEELLAGGRGITTHMQCSRAWPRPNAHQDPGAGFPMTWYLERVNRALAVL